MSSPSRSAKPPAPSASKDDSPKRGISKKSQSTKVGSNKTGSPMVGRAGRSSKSPDRPASKQSQKELSVDQQKAAIEAERAKQHEQWLKSNCTRLKFLYVDKTEKEYIADSRMTSYTELQRTIARFTPKSTSIFAVYDEKGNVVKNADPFRPQPVYLVREVYNRTMIPTSHPTVDTKWDFLSYHARPARWVDKIELKRQAALAKKAEELRMMGVMESAAGGAAVAGVTGNAANNSDEAWEAAVASDAH